MNRSADSMKPARSLLVALLPVFGFLPVPASAEAPGEMAVLMDLCVDCHGGGAGIKLGENIVVPQDTPLCNAWLTLLHGVGVEAERHGDSSGLLKEIVA